MRRALVAGMLLVATAACGDDTTTATTTSARASTSTTLTPTTTTSARPVITRNGVALEPGGIGLADFGDPANAVLAAVEDAFGSPSSSDTGLVEETGELSPCAGQDVRRVRWFDLELVIVGDPGGASLAGWHLQTVDASSTELTTPEGIGLGASVVEVKAVYGDGAFGDSPQGASDQIFLTAPEPPAIRGFVDDAVAGAVTSLDAGDSCLSIAT